MAVTAAHTKAELARMMRLAYEGQNVAICLINTTAALATDDPIETWLQYEVLPISNGYTRFFTGVLPAGTYSTTAERNEQSALDVEFTATTNSISFTHLVVLLDSYTPASYTSGLGPSSLVGSVTLSSGVELSGDQLTLNAVHDDLSDGDPVTITIDAGGTVPTGLTEGTLYYVDDTATDKITLHTATPVASENRVDITAIGTGTMRVRRCRGSVYSVMSESAATVINDSAKVGYLVTLAVDD